MSSQNARSGAKQNSAASAAAPPPAESVQVREPTWLDPGTWSLSTRFFPVYVALLGVFIAIYYFRNVLEPGLDLTSYEDCANSFNYTFRVNAVLQQTRDFANQSWEIAHAFDAFTQVRTPERSIFAADPFPKGKVPPLGMRLDWSSDWARQSFKATGQSLKDNDLVPSVAGPSSLGLGAVMLGQRKRDYRNAATRQMDILLKDAPRFGKGAISFHHGSPELRAEAVNMFPPFLAYYGVGQKDLDLVREAFNQISLYRDSLRITWGSKKGLWKHSVSKSGRSDEGAWSTANAAAAYGMLKVRAIIAGWPPSKSALVSEIASLDSWITEILDATIKVDDDKSQLLRNYLGDTSWSGETSGTALMAATVYRMAKINPERFVQDKYLAWASRKRRAAVNQIDDDGFAQSVADPYNPSSRAAVKVNPEAEVNLLLLGTAWRDSVCAGIGMETYMEETGEDIARWRSLDEVIRSHSFDRMTSFSFKGLYEYIKAQLS